MKSHLIKEDLIPLLKLSIPLILTGLIQSSLYFVENIFLARLGESVLAAGGLVGWLFATLIVIAFGTFGAVSILAALKYGAKDKQGIILVLRDGLWLAFLLTIPAFVLFWNIPIIFNIFGQKPELISLAKLYLHALAWGLFPKFVLIVLYEFLMGLGHSRMIMVLTMLTTPLYIFLSFVLIFGKFGLPALGIAGAGWGMTLSDWLISLLLILFLLFNKEYKSYIRAIFTMAKPSYVWEILHLGIPMGAMYSVEVAFFFAATLMMGTIGIQSLAANQITMQYLGILMGVIFSIAQAVTVRMGHQLGAKQFEVVKNTALTGVFLSTMFMTIIAIFYWITPGVLISVDFDLNNPIYAETIRLTKNFLFACAFFQILECIRITLFGALRAFKDTHFTLLTSIISFWCVSLPLGYFFAIHLKRSGESIWWSMVIGAALGLGLLVWRFHFKMNQVLIRKN